METRKKEQKRGEEKKEKPRFRADSVCAGLILQDHSFATRRRRRRRCPASLIETISESVSVSKSFTSCAAVTSLGLEDARLLPV